MSPVMATQHLTEEEAVGLADGQVVSESASVHVGRCQACSDLVAEHALAALVVHTQLRALGAERERPVLVPSAKKPLILGVIVALAASVPAVPTTMRTLSMLVASRDLHAKALSGAARAGWESLRGTTWSFGTTAVLVAVGAVLAILASRAGRTDRMNEGARS